ncbi:hypothetical protein Q0Z83_005760 [Actinoplanes sichuanensis]|uniref:Uncharacterized protein n=1 Tax=Actinoplanes sichuanensis TaxID=512349 RepID=A0ABW4AI36_9ACTN|nr:hypothetical protein [Actinoplanes sichuanensis]BEL02385.1 hypothetical protein Q0Z83_005760 [Actinoplanes sichuanensis]
MTNTIGTRATSLFGNASSLLGSTKDAFKAMAEAAVNTQGDSPAAIAETAARKGRRGTVLDRYA